MSDNVVEFPTSQVGRLYFEPSRDLYECLSGFLDDNVSDEMARATLKIMSRHFEVINGRRVDKFAAPLSPREQSSEFYREIGKLDKVRMPLVRNISYERSMRNGHTTGLAINMLVSTRAKAETLLENTAYSNTSSEVGIFTHIPTDKLVKGKHEAGDSLLLLARKAFNLFVIGSDETHPSRTKPGGVSKNRNAYFDGCEFVTKPSKR